MDRNLLLAFVLSFAVLALWSRIQGPPPRPGSPNVPGEHEVAQEEKPQGTHDLTPPAVAPTLPRRSAPAAALPGFAVDEVPEGEGEIIRIETPLYAADLTTLGAGIRHWQLKEYDEGPRYDYRPLVLTTGQAPLDTALVTPFEELERGNLALAIFSVSQPDTRTAAFELTRKGVTIRKIFHFEEDSYLYRLRVEVVNGSDGPVSPRFAVAWPAHVATAPDFANQALIVLHDGSVVRKPLPTMGKAGFIGSLTGGKPELVTDFLGDVDWAGVETTYFLAALLPASPSRASARFFATQPGVSGVAQISFPAEEIPAGQTAFEEFKGYIGPKERPRLAALGGDTERSVDLGWSWVAPMTHAFNWMLQALYSVIPNYGVAIIVLTILVRVVTAPLTVKQMRSMERMRALSPKLNAIKEKFPDDRQRQSEETMSLYRKEKVNPLGGCLPMVLQLPVFVGLFYALRSSIQLRQAPFVGWIDDLSTPELLFTIAGPFPIPIRVLPLIMGATMVLQQRLTPMPSVDPTQAKMMQTVMPIMMTVLFYQFPSGLVLYWMVSNILAIAHQRWIGRGLQATAS